MKIFGVGLSRTGTTSLKKSLEILGFNILHHHIPNSRQFLDGKLNLSALNNYDGCVDTPFCSFYKELDTFFPHSKFILTVREKQTWLESSEAWLDRCHYPDKLTWSTFANICTYGIPGFDYVRFSNVYDEHHGLVREYFKNKNNFLEIDICGGETWEKLCTFLNISVPDIQFPHMNRRYIRVWL